MCSLFFVSLTLTYLADSVRDLVNEGDMQEESYKNRQGWASGRVAFVPLSVAELYDSRLTADEKILLLMLRYRSGRNGYTFISWETLTKESGEKRSTLFKKVARLRELGFLQTESRGLSKTSDKAITDPCEIYPDDLIDSHNIGKFFRSDRTDDMIDVLRSVHLSPQIDKGAISSSPASETTQSQKRDPIGLENETTRSLENETNEVPFSGPKLDKASELDKVEKNKADNSPILETRIFVPDPKNQDEDEIRSIENGQALADRVGEDTARLVRGRRVGRRERAIPANMSDIEERKAVNRAARAEEAERQRRDNPESEGGKKRLPAPVWTEFKTKAMKRFDDFFPSTYRFEWGESERSKFKQLLVACSDNADLIFSVWEYSCRNWPLISKKLKIGSPTPSLGILLGYKESIFPMAQLATADKPKLGTKIGEW
jgi:hypothetical protein